MSEDDHTIHERWARLRFAVIGPLLMAPPEPGELAGALAALSTKTWRHPASGAPVRFGFSTLERWYCARLTLEHASRDQLLECLAHLTRSAGNPLLAPDHPRHFTSAIGAATDEQEVPSLHRAAEVGDGDLTAAMAAPDVGQQPLAHLRRDRLPALTGGLGEGRQGFHWRGRWPRLLLDEKLLCRLAGGSEHESRYGHPRNIRRAAQQVPLLGRHPQRDANPVRGCLVHFLHRVTSALSPIQAITT
jgi:hypothetical protein